MYKSIKKKSYLNRKCSKKENSILTKRIRMLKPHYSANDFAQKRKKEKHIIHLRRTDHTSEFLSLTRRAYSAPNSGGQKKILLKPLKPLAPAIEGSIIAKRNIPNLTNDSPEEEKLPLISSPEHPAENIQCKSEHRVLFSPALNNEEDQAIEQGCFLSPKRKDTDASVTTSNAEQSRRRLSSLMGLTYHVVYEAKREYYVEYPQNTKNDLQPYFSENDLDSTSDSSSSKKKWRCSVSVGAQEPYTILTELEVIVRREGSSNILAKQCMTISEAALDYGCTEHVSRPEWDEAYDLQETLLNMFQEADDDGNGTLSKDEFQNLLQDTDLGLTEAEMLILLDEVDENDDEHVCYEEFMPVAIDLLQSFKARRFAKRAQAVTEQQIEQVVMATLEEAPEHNPKNLAQAAMQVFMEADQRGQGTLAKHEFKRCLKHESLNLSKTEQYMVLKQMPVDAFGKIIFKQYKDIVHGVKHTTVKREILENQASEMEEILFGLCREEERNNIHHETPGDQDSISTPAVIVDFIYDGHITMKQIQSVLANPKIGLSRLQITSVLSEAESYDNMVNYYQFIPLAATIIDKLRDSAFIEAKTQVLAKNLRGVGDKVNTKLEADLARELHELFDQHDTDNSAGLDQTEFGLCMESLELGLTKVNIDALMVQADTDHNGVVDRSEFMEFTLKNLVGLIKERRLALLRKDVEAIARGDSVDSSHFEVPEDIFEAIQSPQWDNNTADAHRELVALFRKADANKEGCLSSSEFHRVLDAFNLGLTSYQKARLMAEADDDEDGYITYSEFVPFVSRFLQIFRAKKKSLICLECSNYCY
uniref:EF-hand domain-containing protein n=1 Tax=Aureoumbra lagunensis TaxID=44058 RepID=A0A7S3NKP0_9STRA